MSNLTTTIPAGWQYAAVKGPDGGELYSFTNMISGLVVFIAAETANATISDLNSYANAIRASNSSTLTFGAWSQSTNPYIWKASGMSGQSATTMYITLKGQTFWRVVYVDQVNKSPREIVDPGMTYALFKSAGVAQ